MDSLKTYPDTFETNDNYWDCECETDYIHKIEKSACRLCSAIEIEQPPSRQAEIDGSIKEVNYESISNLKPILKNEWKVGAMYLAMTIEYDGHNGGVLIYGELTGDYDDDPMVLTKELSVDDSSMGFFCTQIAEMPILDGVNLMPSATQ